MGIRLEIPLESRESEFKNVRRQAARRRTDLFVRVDVDVALDALLARVGPAVARHPLALAARTLVLAETALLALVRRHRLGARPPSQALQPTTCHNTIRYEMLF